jgi:Protein kinase domain
MSRVLGRYELVRPLARGGMAEVFLARRRAAGVEKLFVVKRIRSERAGDLRFRELFRREAKLSMSLTHQNIVQTFDFGSVGEQFFLAMERVEGKDLGGSLARDKGSHPLPPLVAAFIAAECCQALDYAHGRRQDGANLGVVHRDVTLRNVLVSWSGEVKLTDFGIATLAGEDTSKLVGTPAFMAPEQARGEAIDVRTDVYAVGMVLRELLTGERARPGDDRDALIAAARQGTLAPWTGDVDAALVAIVDRATAAKPTDRYPVAGEMFADLDSFIVAQRAARRGDSPARQLAAWLAKVWGDDRDDISAGDVELEGGAEMMSFLDDAAAVGTGTERSLAATAADEPAPRDTPVAIAAVTAPPATVIAGAALEGSSSSSAPRAIASSSHVAAASIASGAAEATASTAGSSRGVDDTLPVAPPRRLPAMLVVAAVAAIAIVIAVVALGRGGPRSTTPSGSAIALTADAALDLGRDAAFVEEVDAAPIAEDAAVRPPADLGGARQGSGTREGSGARQGSATAVAGSGSARAGSGSARAGSGGVSATRAGSGSAAGTTVRAGSGSAASGSAQGSNTGSATVVLRKVHINATPWAFFTVDGVGPRHQTPKLLELAPGPHSIYFENDVLKVQRTITLVVPADRDMSHVEPLR